MKLYDWILCRLDTDVDRPLPETLFDDLQFFNSVFPLAKAKWAAQPDAILCNLALAHPVAIDVAAGGPVATLQLYRASKFKCSPGQRFRLIPRYVDFNLPKILRNFLEIDIEARTDRKSLFLRLLENPGQVGQTTIGNEYDIREEIRLTSLYRQLQLLGNSDASQLVFKRSQREAMRSILKRQATIIWGPPGTGKTHTLALSMLYLLEILYLNSENVVVWMTAVTNAAIEMFLSKFQFLLERIRAIPNLDSEWLDKLTVLRVTAGAKTPPPTGRLTLAAGTVWQLWNWNEKKSHSVNVLVIDEAGQMNVGTAALAMRWLNEKGRLVGAFPECSD
jgi:AAA domain